MPLFDPCPIPLSLLLDRLLVPLPRASFRLLGAPPPCPAGCTRHDDSARRTPAHSPTPAGLHKSVAEPAACAPFKGSSQQSRVRCGRGVGRKDHSRSEEPRAAPALLALRQDGSCKKGAQIRFEDKEGITKEGITMSTKRRIEVFSAGCPACEEAIELVNRVDCPSCEVSVLDMRDPNVASRAKRFGIRLVPTVVIDGRMAACCVGRGPDGARLRAAGLGTTDLMGT